MQNDLTKIVIRSPDSDSEDNTIENFIEESIELFDDNKIYKKAENGMICEHGDIRKPHPLLRNLNNKNKRKSLEAKERFDNYLRNS